MREEIVNFYTTAGSSANKTLVSKRIDVPYRITRIRALLEDTANWTVNLYPFVSLDPEEPTAAAPAGLNILSEFSQAPYFSGDGHIIDVRFNHWVKEAGTYLKLYITNSAATTPHILVQVTIVIED